MNSRPWGREQEAFRGQDFVAAAPAKRLGFTGGGCGRCGFLRAASIDSHFAYSWLLRMHVRRGGCSVVNVVGPNLSGLPRITRRSKPQRLPQHPTPSQ